MPSAHVLHRSCTRLSCGAVTKATARRGESADGVARLRQAGAFLPEGVIRPDVTRHCEYRPRSYLRLGPRQLPDRSNGLTSDREGNQMTTMQTKSLYDRLGGGDAINALPESWVARVGGDDRANGKFARTDIDRLKKEVVDQLCEATGGPCTYTGRSMLETHAGMKVTAGEFDVVMQHLE